MILKKYVWVLPVLLAFVLAGPLLAQTQKSLTLKELEQRIKVLEGQKDYLEKTSEIIKVEAQVVTNRINCELDLLKKNFEVLKAEIESAERNHDRVITFIWIILGAFGIATFGGALGHVKYIRKKLREHADTVIAETFAKEKENVLAIVEQQNEVAQLKKESEIIVWTPADGDDSFIKAFFEKMEFKLPWFTHDLQELKGCDLIVLNCENAAIDEQSLIDVVNKQTDTVFFFFGKYIKELAEKKNVAFANVRSQIYGNIINALLYSPLLKG